jgi:Alpha-lytic protease prodomain
MREIHSSSPRHGLAAALALSAAMIVPFAVSAAPPQDPPASAPNKELLSAMRRDLGLDAQQVTRYLDAERSAMARTPEAVRRLGTAYAGSWLEHGKDGRFRLVVAATNADAAAKARALGAETRVVKRSLAQLDAAKSRLDRVGKQRKADPGIHAWYVDVKTNQVVLEVGSMAHDAALGFVAASGIDATAVRFEESEGAPQLATIVGGERYNIYSSWCSIGIPVTRGMDTGFTTAGHCGGIGTPTVGTNGISQGVFAGSIFPGNDMAWVQITNPSSWPLSNSVNNYIGSAITVVGSTPALVGAGICRSGAKTGYRCGVVRANGISVNYTAGTVYGLTSTSACIGKGDSGGAYITPTGQAQGVASGGKSISTSTGHNCNASSPTSYHQPLIPLMSQFGLTLFTGNQQTPPIITNLNCPRIGDTGDGFYVCSLQYSSHTPATVEWLGEIGNSYTTENYSEFFGECTEGQYLNITAVVTNAAGSTSTPMQTFLCVGWDLCRKQPRKHDAGKRRRSPAPSSLRASREKLLNRPFPKTDDGSLASWADLPDLFLFHMRKNFSA